MRTIQKTIDINAHIEELRCEISVDNGNAIAKISFINLGFGDITAIKFNACGYNSFGDIVPVNGNEKFYLIIQDVMIAKNEIATDLTAKLPNDDIKKLDLEECQICYADGSVASYEGNNDLMFDIEEIDNPEELKAIHKVYNEHIKYRLKDFEQGWICGCGRFNLHTSNKCSLCNQIKADTINACSVEGLKKTIEKAHEQEEEERRQKEQQEIQDAKDRRKKNIGIFVIVVCVIALIALMANSIIISNRETYSSVDEMREAMQGTWSHYSSWSYDVLWQIEIEGDKCTQVWESGTDGIERDITWNPSRGTFKVGSDTFVVNKGERTLTEGDYEYEKGGYMSDSDYSSSSYESGYSVLDICDLEWDSNSSYTVCVGKVKNTGTKTYYYVEVKGSFEDSSGNVLDTDWTYAVGSEGLAPGESSSFRLSVDKDYDITDCSVTILDFD